MRMPANELLERVTEFYMNSGDFNGFPVPGADLGVDELRQRIRPLVESGQLYVNYGDRHPNPHILAFEPEPAEVQVRKLDEGDLASACLYPTVAHLRTVVDQAEYAGRPYTLELALGYPVLGYHCFDLSILESYRNDPRYYYTFDIDGMISVSNEHYEQPTMDKRDQVLLQTFGLALAKEVLGDRGVPALPEHAVARTPADVEGQAGAGRPRAVPAALGVLADEHGRVAGGDVALQCVPAGDGAGE